MNDNCDVWLNGEFLGNIQITLQDWVGVTNWRAAALAAARRVFGTGRNYHVVSQTYLCGERV